jgi:hypothetical protein
MYTVTRVLVVDQSYKSRFAGSLSTSAQKNIRKRGDLPKCGFLTCSRSALISFFGKAKPTESFAAQNRLFDSAIHKLTISNGQRSHWLRHEQQVA